MCKTIFYLIELINFSFFLINAKFLMAEFMHQGNKLNASHRFIFIWKFHQSDDEKKKKNLLLFASHLITSHEKYG